MTNHPGFDMGYQFARGWQPDASLPQLDVDTEAGRRFEVGLAVGMLRNATGVRQAWQEACVLAGRPLVAAVYRPAGVLDDQPLEPCDDLDSGRDQASVDAGLMVGHGYQMRRVNKPSA